MIMMTNIMKIKEKWDLIENLLKIIKILILNQRKLKILNGRTLILKKLDSQIDKIRFETLFWSQVSDLETISAISILTGKLSNLEIITKASIREIKIECL